MMLRAICAGVSGVIFGLGLLISGMNNPAKVRAFLDVFGNWGPELAAVMASAVLVFALAFWFGKSRNAPFFASTFHPPSLVKVDRRLLGGAALFGLGWGLVGLCPGPALVDLLSLDADIWLFVLALLLGNRAAHYLVGPAK